MLCNYINALASHVSCILLSQFRFVAFRRFPPHFVTSTVFCMQIFCIVQYRLELSEIICGFHLLV